MAANKIPETLHGAILDKAGGGQSVRQIAAWLGAEHSIQVSYRAVARMLAKTKVERSEVAKSVIRDKLSRTVLNDLDRLTREQVRVEKLASRLHKRAREALDDIEKASRGEGADVDALRVALAAVDSFTDLALKASDRVRALADRKLHYSGADEPDDSLTSLAEAERRLAGRLDRIAERNGTGEGSS